MTDKKPISKLSSVYSGRQIAILGGGPSLPSDYAKLPKGCLLIGVNHHWTKVKGLKVDYMVYSDNPKKHTNLQKALNRADCEVIAPPPYDKWADYTLNVSFWNQGYSSSVATWLGCYMTDQEVILCGMDCYQGKVKYFYNDEDTPPTHPTFLVPIQSHLNVWRMARVYCKNPSRIKAMSGPLIDLFGQYEGEDKRDIT